MVSEVGEWSAEVAVMAWDVLARAEEVLGAVMAAAVVVALVMVVLAVVIIVVLVVVVL